MSTAAKQMIDTGRRRRRRHSKLFKEEAVGACQQAGVSVAAVALARGVNANLLRRWVAQAERSKSPNAIRSAVPNLVVEHTERFLPVTLPPSPTGDAIRIKVRRRGGTVSIEWPVSGAHECALLLRELMK